MHFIGLSLGAGFSITGETFDYEGEGDYNPIVYYNNYTFNVKYNFRKSKIILMANLKYYDKTPSLAVDTKNPDDFNDDELYQVYTEAHGDIEATITKLLWKNRLSVVLGGKNLLDNYSSKTYGYRKIPNEYLSPIGYGRTFFIKLKLNLKINN